jgi:DNA polymerase-3 subunit delta
MKVLTISVLFSFFSNLLQFHYTGDKSQQNVARVLGVNPFFVKDFAKAAGVYNASKCMQCISLIREYDAKSKGIGSRATAGELLKELVFKIMH